MNKVTFWFGITLAEEWEEPFQRLMRLTVVRPKEQVVRIQAACALLLSDDAKLLHIHAVEELHVRPAYVKKLRADFGLTAGDAVMIYETIVAAYLKKRLN